WARVAAVLGINCLSQDAAACLLVDGRLVARRRRRELLTASSTPRPSRTRRSPSAGSRLHAARDQPYRHEPLRPRLRCAVVPPRGAAQSGPRQPGRAAGPAGAGPRGRETSRIAPGAPPGTRDRTGRRSPASTPSPSSSAVPRCCAAAPSYVQIDPRGAELLFQIIIGRDECASIGIGTSLPFR